MKSKSEKGQGVGIWCRSAKCSIGKEIDRWRDTIGYRYNEYSYMILKFSNNLSLNHFSFSPIACASNNLYKYNCICLRIYNIEFTY